MIAIVLAAIAAVVLSLWCSNERRIIQSEHQEQIKEDIDEFDELQRSETVRYVFRKSHG